MLTEHISPGITFTSVTHVTSTSYLNNLLNTKRTTYSYTCKHLDSLPCQFAYIATAADTSPCTQHCTHLLYRPALRAAGSLAADHD